jgi:hypothetical protein
MERQNPYQHYRQGTGMGIGKWGQRAYRFQLGSKGAETARHTRKKISNKKMFLLLKIINDGEDACR